MDVDDLAREYADAQAHASDGTRRPGGPVVPDGHGRPCTPEMARLDKVQSAILALAGTPNLPEPVAAFIAADADKGCSRCWLSPFRGRNHPDCNRKIDRWFDARRSLVAYGRSV